MQRTRDAAILYINGERHEVRGEAAFLMLADYLRYEQGLVGTKIVCAEGDCGACTVLRAFGPTPSFTAINACIVTVAQMDGSHLVTVEGLKTAHGLSPVQEAVAQCHGSQCGYCTPGFVMAITACLQKSSEPLDEQSVKNHLTGNLCRCTGYSPLIAAALRVDRASLPSLNTRYLSPALCKDLKQATRLPLHLIDGQRVFLAPNTLDDALRWRRKYPDARIIAAATDLGVQVNKGKLVPETLLSLHLIPELYTMKKIKDRLHCGARASLADVRRHCESHVPEFARFLNIFASPQIKNLGTLVGNIANGSPIGDTLPFLMVSDAVVHVASNRQTREIPITTLYTGYRRLALKPHELITAVSFRIPKANEHLRLFKASQRRDLDISTVNSAFLFQMQEQKGSQDKIVKSARICYGGVGPTVLRFSAAEDFLQGKTLSEATVTKAIELVQDQITPLSDVRGTAAYRRALVDGLFRKYCESLQQEATHP